VRFGPPPGPPAAEPTPVVIGLAGGHGSSETAAGLIAARHFIDDQLAARRNPIPAWPDGVNAPCARAWAKAGRPGVQGAVTAAMAGRIWHAARPGPDDVSRARALASVTFMTPRPGRPDGAGYPRSSREEVVTES
jgi:hypothetical protein